MDKLLELLDRNARLTDEQLAIMLGRSEQEVSERICRGSGTGLSAVQGCYRLGAYRPRLCYPR